MAGLRPVFAEFARVLRPGGHLVVSDVHHEAVRLGSMPRVRLADDTPGVLPAHFHRASDYLGAALRQGFQLRSCEEPRLLPPPAAGRAAEQRSTSGEADPPFLAADLDPGPWDVWPWSLQPLIGEALDAAQAGTPATVIWHFQLADR